MVKWILFWTIVLVNILGTHLFDDINLDDLDDVLEDFDGEISLKIRDKLTAVKDIDCLDFPKYTYNCTVGAALFYNSPRVTPPLPSKINDWCKSVRYLTRCAIDWNMDCKDSTDSLFNEGSIKGHMHVIDNICDDEWFLSRYSEVTDCVRVASDDWEDCYATFKLIVDEQKNITREWTHYETHFYLCCAQAQFRRCTLDFLFKLPKCPYDQAVTVQKFTVIISEGDVFQDCNGNIVYANCPNGDPTPSQQQLKMLMDGGDSDVSGSNADIHPVHVIVRLLCQFILIKFFV